MKTVEKFRHWIKNVGVDSDVAIELRNIQSKLETAKEAGDSEAIKKIEADLEDRFYCDLEFGTGGLRGIIGAGTNRMNDYTVARATQGLADFVKSFHPKKASVAIAFDSRIKSKDFANIAARVLAANGIKAYVRNELMPTPMLSFAVRELKCSAGIMITASHNPSKYNGYKAYGSDGCQLSLVDSEAVLTRIKSLDIFKDVQLSNYDDAYDKALITRIDDSIIDKFFINAKAQSLHPGICRNAGLKVVYTPLNGAGNKHVRRILKETGVSDVTVVPEQEKPDGNFPTCPYPNPEFPEALEYGLRLAKEEQADLLLATDPDCDRVAIAVKNSIREYELFTGNEVGAMLLEYICREKTEAKTMPPRPIAVKSIVSTAIAAKIAKKYDVKLIDTLTGFKFIGEVAGKLEKEHELSRFLFGFEESIGYMAGSYVRDKDAVCASMLICEMAAFYKKRGMTLVAARDKMYEEYGYYYNYTQNLTFEGLAGVSQMDSIMDKLRRSTPNEIGGVKVVYFTDYKKKLTIELAHKDRTPKETGLPKSNVLKFELNDGSVIIVRPSGTEPKLKIYYTAIGVSADNSARLQQATMDAFSKLIGV